jgi:hypothetical protein
MVRKEGGRDQDAGEKPASPEIRAEKSERKRFEEARQEHRIVDGVRMKID